MTRLYLTIAALLGLGGIVNGVMMLAEPMNWYFAVPGVTGTGPFNQHFIRDIGLIYLLTGVALLVGLVRPMARTWLWGAAAAWLSGHALFHFWEVATGICSPNALARDFAGVTLPAIITLLLTAWSMRELRSEHNRPAAA